MKKLKIGILTFHFVQNYGGLLQAYALQRYLQELGHEVEFINYRPDWVENGGRFWLPVSKRALHADIVIAYQKGINLYHLLFGNKQLSQGYSDFRRKFLNEGERRYKTLKELKDDPPLCDVYVCGSDQIWNPSVQFGMDSAYFLDFGGAKRVAYAASFGRGDIEAQYHDEMGRLLRRIDAIGVREQSGAKLIERITGRKPRWVPDPTLLLSNYDEILEVPRRENDYIMSYVLRSGEGIGEVQRQIAECLGLEMIVPYNQHRRWNGIGTEVTCSPGQWLGYIKNARMMVTNSFHGTLFSVIFKKQFIFVGLGGKKAVLNERSVSFLERIGLSERIVHDDNPKKIEHLVATPIDWPRVDALTDAWKREACDFLRESIGQDGMNV